MWETKTPLPKALQRLINTPARRPTHRGSLHSKSNTGETSHQFGIEPSYKLHKPRTLQTNTPHWHIREATNSRHLFIAFDPHPSVAQLIPIHQQKTLTSFFSQWGTRQQLHVQFLKGSTSQGWGADITTEWQQQLRSFRDGKLLILSDFHGPTFFSDSLRQLIHHFDTHFVRLCHPPPMGQNIDMVRSMNHVSEKLHLFDPVDFDQRFNIWNRQTELALKKTGCPYFSTSDMDSLVVVKGILKLWS